MSHDGHDPVAVAVGADALIGPLFRVAPHLL